MHNIWYMLSIDNAIVSLTRCLLPGENQNRETEDKAAKHYSTEQTTVQGHTTSLPQRYIVSVSAFAPLLFAPYRILLRTFCSL